MTTDTLKSHPGHELILATELSPAEALDAWEDLLSADYDSRRTDGVLISSAGSFIGMSAYLDHGTDKALDILLLAIASATDGMWAERAADEGTLSREELFAQTTRDGAYWVGQRIYQRMFEVYGGALWERELARRAEEAEEANDTEQSEPRVPGDSPA